MPTPQSVCKAIGNQYRFQIVELLLDGEKNVTTLNKSVKVSQPALSQHLSKLRREGLLGHRREQRQIFYYIKNPTIIRLVAIAKETAAFGVVLTEPGVPHHAA